MSTIIGGAIAGAVGGGLAVTVLAPLTAANNFLGSYFFGSGMILGERQMYQDDWIKIKKRLDAGESFLVILEEVMKPNTQAVMQMARETVIAVADEWNDIVLEYIKTIPQAIFDAIDNLGGGGGGSLIDDPDFDGVIGKINGVVQCAAGWTPNADKTLCIKNPEKHIHTPDHHKTDNEKRQDKKDKEARDKKLTIEIENAKDLELVGTGKTRADLRKTIKVLESHLQTFYDQRKKSTKSALTKALTARITQFIRIIRAHKNMLNLISSTNKQTT